MNAFAMKLESRQHLTVTNEEKSKDLIGYKKCKSVKKKSLSINSDKDALLNCHGLGRKFTDAPDISSLNLNSPTKHDLCKKIRSKKPCLKVDKMFTESDKIQERLQRSLSNEDKEKILTILNEIRALSDIEKLYLYLQLPTGSSFEVDPFKQKNLNPLGKKADEEGIFAVTWIQSHLEEDPDVSLPKQEVYDEYQSYCNLTGTDPLCAADFGKVMKQIFPSVKPRRLGTRGNSRYCYSGLRKKIKLVPPSIPDIQKEKENCSSEDNFGDEVTAAACHLLFEWAEKLLGMRFNSVKELAAHLVENMYVDNRSVAAFTVLLDASPDLLSKGLSTNEGGIKKTEAQFHLQRKIQEKELIKEQKRKLQEQRTHIALASKGKGLTPKKKPSRKSRLLSPQEFGFDEEKIRINVQDQAQSKDDKSPENTDLKKGDEITLQAKESETISLVADAQSEGTVPKVNIKKEDCFTQAQPGEMLSSPKVVEQSLSNLLVSPLSSPSSGHGDVEDSKVRRKSLIPQNKTPVCIAQSLPGIIIVPSLPQLATEISKQTAITPKYKRIQPKPLHGDIFSTVARSRAGSVGSSLPSKPKVRNLDGRRSSHAWLHCDNILENGDDKSMKTSNNTNINISFKSIQEKAQNISLKDNIRFETPHDSKLISENMNEDYDHSNEKIKKPELQINSRLLIQTGDLDEIEESNSTKRHLDDKDDHTHNKRVHLDLYKFSNESSWITSASNTNSLSAQISSNKFTGIGQEEVNVHEIEGDALNDYFRGANNHNSINSVQQSDLEQLSSTNKVKQLSQLRMLLEQNLPSAISKTPLGSVKTQKVSKSVDTSETVLSNLSEDTKKSFSPVLQDSSKSLISNTVFENTIDSPNVTNNNSFLKSDSQYESLERLLCPSYLVLEAEANVESQLLSDPNVFLNGSRNSVQDMDVSLQSELNQNSSTSDILLSSTLQSDPELIGEQVNVAISYGRVNTCTQVPSVPQSPNTRRRAFNFMPISPRHTPIPDGVHLSGTSSVSSPHLRTMMSTGVGPSQPPSNSGSPFVSPRSTPVPLCRSRHSSGQSTYSTSRHTPFQNFDSGVSSVSSSPFISPQPTPVPVSRLRHNSSHGSNKTVTFCSVNSPQVINAHSASNNVPHLRTRHSSGPGAPHIATTSPRCTSLSPLVTEQCPAPSFLFPSSSEIRSRHNSGSNTTTPLSPVSEQASSSSSCASNIPDLSGVNESQSFLNDGAGDLLISANPSSFKQVRQRHVSSSVLYGKSRDIFSQEIQKLLRNNPDNGTSDLMMNNRSQSVPLHQMLQTTDGFCFLTQPIEDACPKSHPSTPVINQIFSFPIIGSTPESTSLSLGMDTLNRDKSVIQNSQMEWTGFESSDLDTASSARRNLSVLYDAPPPLSDDLQTTLEDLRDCDTDFSKLELELRQNEESGL